MKRFTAVLFLLMTYTAAIRGESVARSVHATLDTGSFDFGQSSVHSGIIVSIRSVVSSDALGGQPGVEIRLFSDDEFPVRDEILVLQIGARQFLLSGYANGDLNTLVFTLTEEEFVNVASGESVIVQYGVGPSDELWQFGTLDKSVLDQ